MSPSFLFYLPIWLVALGIFIILIIFDWLGYHYRKMHMRKHPDEVDSLGPMEGSLLGLMALLLAFSFSMAASKYENRRLIIIDEANYTRTAINISYLYPDSIRNTFLAEFREYVEARIGYNNAANDTNLIQSCLGKTRMYSTRLLKIAIQQAQNPENNFRTAQMLPALNHMADITTAREESRKAKTPPLILGMLLLLTFSAAFLVGYGSKAKKRNFVMRISFALMTTLTLYVIMEMDWPRRGLINLDEAAKNITELRDQLRENKLGTH